MRTTKEQIDKFEDMFMIFAHSLGIFGSEIEEANFKNEVGLISFSTARKLEELYTEIEEYIRRARAFDNMKTRMK